MSPNAPFLAPERDSAYARGRMKASGGSTGYEIPGVVLGVTPGTVTPSANNLNYAQVLMKSPRVLSKLAFEVTTGQTANLRVGIYAADTDWQPVGAPLADSGSISTSTTGVKTYSPTPFVLPRGRYLLAFVHDAAGSNPQLRFFRGGLEEGTNMPTTMGGTFNTGFFLSFTYAALPSSGHAWTSYNTSATDYTWQFPVVMELS